jgi:hypothetical protein
VVLLFEWNESDRIDSELQPGDTACLEDSRSVWIRTEQGEVEELPARDHPNYVHVGNLISTDPEINEGSYDNVIGPLGRIGDVYFAWTGDEGWERAFRAESDDAAVDIVRAICDSDAVEIAVAGS